MVNTLGPGGFNAPNRINNGGGPTVRPQVSLLREDSNSPASSDVLQQPQGGQNLIEIFGLILRFLQQLAGQNGSTSESGSPPCDCSDNGDVPVSDNGGTTDTSSDTPTSGDNGTTDTTGTNGDTPTGEDGGTTEEMPEGPNGGTTGTNSTPAGTDAGPTDTPVIVDRRPDPNSPTDDFPTLPEPTSAPAPTPAPAPAPAPSQVDRDKATIDYLIQHAGDIPADGSYNGDDLDKAAGYSSDQNVKDGIGKIRQAEGALSLLDGHPGDLNRNELEGIKKLLDQGFTLDQVISSAEHGPSTLPYHQVKPGFNSPDDQKAADQGVQFLLDHADQIPADGSYNGDDLDKAAGYASDQATKDLILKIRDNEAALSFLDGHPGDLNKDELKQIQDLVKQGFSIDYLIEEGQLLGRFNVVTDSNARTNLGSVGFPKG